MRKTTWMTLVLAGAMAFGCDDAPADPDAGPDMEDSGPTPMVDSGPTPDAGPGGDGNDSFGEADPITLGMPAEGRAISEPGDLDYYSFEGTEGQWISITTEANPDDDPEMVDTVLTLYDASMSQIAENDDAIPRANTDSEIITRLPADGTYYVLVQEFSTWFGDPDEGMPSFQYDLVVAELNTGSPAVTADAEGGDDVASAQALGYNVSAMGDFGLLVGGLRDASDVDVFSFSITADKPFPQFTILPGGTEGMGSTATPTAVWVTDDTGAPVIGRIDPSQLDELSPALPEGDYLFWVEHGGTEGANDFYVIKAFRFTQDNPAETEPNDDAASAEALTFADDDGDGVRTGFFLAMLPDGDTDFFSIDVMDGEPVSIFCGSRTGGSGVVDLEVALTESDGSTVIESATETATEAVAIEEAAVSGAGTYLVRLTKGSQDAEVTGDWVRCGVALGSFPTP